MALAVAPICSCLVTTDVGTFPLLVGHVYIFFGEMFIQIFCPLKNYLFFSLLSLRVLHGFCTLDPHQICDVQSFLPFCRLSFHSLDNGI